MRFYAREEEIGLLQDCWDTVKTNKVAQMLTVVGRRRVGKTTLILKAFERIQETTPVFYFFVERKTTEKQLVSVWLDEICSAYHIEFPPALQTIGDVINYLMTLSREKPCVCIIDECQDFNLVDPNVWSQIQKVWDLKKAKAQMLLVMSGSIITAMEEIFSDNSQPLYGRPSYQLLVKPFTPQVVKEIVFTENSEATVSDVLTIYSMTGGIPKYIEILAEAHSLSAEGAINFICSSRGQWLRSEGEVYLANEFRAEAVIYNEILHAIANGATKWNEIQDKIDSSSQLSPYLNRLERFGIIQKNQPIFEPSAKRNTKYRIVDQYLLFWLTFISPLIPRSMAESGNWLGLKQFCEQRLPQFLGSSLERWFIEFYRHSHQWEVVDGWWDKNGVNEIDLVAVNSTKKNIEFAEVKLNPKKYEERHLQLKVAIFLEKHPKLKPYEIVIRGLSPKDIDGM